MSHKAPKSRPKQAPQGENLGKKGRRLILGGILAIATLLGYVVLIPRPVIAISDPVDPSDPFSASISVTNTGYVPLHNVHVGIPVKDIASLVGPGLAGDSEYGTVVFPDAGNAGDLGIDDKFSFPLNKVMDGDKGNLKSADIGILVQYELPVIGVKRYKLSLAHVDQQKNGNFYWYVSPLAKAYSFKSGYRISGPIHFPHSQKSN